MDTFEEEAEEHAIPVGFPNHAAMDSDYFMLWLMKYWELQCVLRISTNFLGED